MCVVLLCLRFGVCGMVVVWLLCLFVCFCVGLPCLVVFDVVLCLFACCCFVFVFKFNASLAFLFDCFRFG